MLTPPHTTALRTRGEAIIETDQLLSDQGPLSVIAFQTGKNCTITHFQKLGWNQFNLQITKLNSYNERQ